MSLYVIPCHMHQRIKDVFTSLETNPHFKMCVHVIEGLEDFHRVSNPNQKEFIKSFMRKTFSLIDMIESKSTWTI